MALPVIDDVREDFVTDRYEPTLWADKLRDLLHVSYQFSVGPLGRVDHKALHIPFQQPTKALQIVLPGSWDQRRVHDACPGVFCPDFVGRIPGVWENESIPLIQESEQGYLKRMLGPCGNDHLLGGRRPPAS